MPQYRFASKGAHGPKSHHDGVTDMTVGKSQAELTQLVDEALRSQPGCETARVPAVQGLPAVLHGRNWEIPNVVLGDSLISDVDRAVIMVHRRLGRQFHLLMSG
jgi:hypothetical protein